MYVLCGEFQKPNVWSKKNAGVLERSQNDLEQKTEGTDVMDRARHAVTSVVVFIQGTITLSLAAVINTVVAKDSTIFVGICRVGR